MKQKFKFIKLFMLTVMAFFAQVAFATDVEIGLSPDEISWTASGDDQTATVGAINLIYAKAGSSTATSQGVTAAGHLRLYKNSTFTVSCAKNITKIAFTVAGSYSTSNLVPDVGAVEDDAWTGEATSVTFTLGAQVRLSKIIVTYSDGGVAVTAPTISGESKFTSSTEVSIASESGASVYYTTDGTDPTESSTVYTSPFTIDETTTVKAIAVKGTDKSSVASKTFTKVSSVATIAEMNALSNGTEFIYTGTATVVYANGSYVYIKDDSGSSLIFKSGTGLEKGDVIASGWEGKVSIYKNLFEVVPSTTLEKDGLQKIVTYPDATTADLVADNMNQVVALKGVTYTAPEGKNFTIGDGIAGYNQFGLEITAPEEGVKYDIEGAISVRDANVQFLPISIAAHVHNFVKDEANCTEPTCSVDGVYASVCSLCGETKTEGIPALGHNYGEYKEFSKEPTCTEPGREYIACLRCGDLKSDTEIPALGHDFNSDGVCIRCGYTESAELEVPGTVIWSSDEAQTIDWSSGKSVVISGDNFASVNVGDILNIGVLGAPADAAPDNWTYQVALQEASTWKNVESGEPLKQAGDYVHSFVVTGDMLKLLQTNGLGLNGTVYNVKKVAVESKYSGSDESIWVGDFTISGWNWLTIMQEHFANANDFAGVEAGQILRINGAPTSGANLVLKYQGPGTSWAFTDFEGVDVNSCATETGYDVPVTEEMATKLKENRLLIQGDGGVQVTSVELLPAPSVVEPEVVDITVAPESGDIAEAVAAEAKTVTDAGNIVGGITINLTEGVDYTVGSTITAAGNVIINGNGATVDASGLSGNMIEMAVVESPEGWTKADVTITKLTVKGLQKALFYSAGKNYVAENFTIDDCVVEQAADASTIDYTKGSTALNLTVTNSTFYAPTATTKSFYSSQGGQKATEYDGSATQTFTFKNNTMYNLATGKNFFSHRQNGQKWLIFDIEQNIFVDCGKSGQVLPGLNGGQRSANPVYTVTGNLFNFGGADTSASESTADDTEPVQDSVEGTIVFNDPTAPDFSGTVLLGPSATAPSALGDPRWTLTYGNALAINISSGEGGTVTASPSSAAEGMNVTLTITPDEGYELDELKVVDSEGNVIAEQATEFTMGSRDVTVTATFKKSPVDVAITVESGKDIAAEVEAAADGAPIKSITVDLEEEGTYTISKSLTAQGNVIINGNGATIDASSLSDPVITLSGGTTFAPKADGTESDHVLVENVTIKDVTITGQQGALLRDAQKSLVETVTIENSVIEMPAAGKNVLDFNSKGYAGKVIVKNSTIWSAGKNTGFFAQYGSRPKNVNGDLLQEFDFENSTIVNIANGKNFNDLKQNGTAQNVYTIKNNIFSDCGKAGQVVVGFNKGQTSATPVWDVDGNTFLQDGADNSAAEISKAGQKNGEDIVKNCLESDPEFKDAASGDFTVGESTDQAELETGDPRWLVEYAGGEGDATDLLAEIDEAKKLLKYSMPYYDENNEESPDTEGKALVDAIREAEEKAEDGASQKKLDKMLEALKQAEIDYANALMEYELAESEDILASADPADELAAEIQRLYDSQDVVREDYWNQPKNIKNYADELDKAQKAYLRNAINELMPEAQALADDPVVYKAIDTAKKALDGDSSEDLFDALNGLLEAMETATGIRGVEANETDAPVYNMAGQRVGKNVKGIVIKNGKKVVRK